MPADIRIGCCGFPEARARYYTRFRAVEVQQTFYDPPAPALASKWRSEAPDYFEFSMKAWQLITHEPSSPTYRRLRSRPVPRHSGRFGETDDVREGWARTLEFARELHAPAIVFQCPASFRPEPRNLENMRRFFEAAEREGRVFAWEPRGVWPLELIAGICRDLGLTHCVDPFAADPAAGPETYFRLHGIGGYAYRYSDDELEEVARKVREREGRVWVMFNNTAMRQDAIRFVEIVSRV